MTIKLDIISGFLGAGKTTLINKLLREAYAGEQIAILENEFGEAGIDGDILRSANLNVKELSNGCICCTLQGSFIEGIVELVQQYAPDRIVIEPTGLSRLNDILKACMDAAEKAPVVINAAVVIVNARSYPALIEVGGEFFTEQISDAGMVLVSAVQNIEQGEMDVEQISASIMGINPDAHIIASPYDELDGLELMAKAEQFTHDMLHRAQSGNNGGRDSHGHSEHVHDEHDNHGHGGHHHDHAEEMDGFSSLSFSLGHVWPDGGIESFAEVVKGMGHIFRMKGFVPTKSGMVKLDFVYGTLGVENSVYEGAGKLVVIGRELDEGAITKLLEEVAHG